MRVPCWKAVDLGGDALSGVKRLQEMTRKDVEMWRRLFLISIFFTVPLLLAHWLQVRLWVCYTWKRPVFCVIVCVPTWCLGVQPTRKNK